MRVNPCSGIIAWGCWLIRVRRGRCQTASSAGRRCDHAQRDKVWVDGTAVDIDAGRVTLAEPTHASARKGGRCESGDECKVWLDKSAAAPHLAAVIGSIRHRGLRNYWATGQTMGFGWNDDGAADVDIEDYHR